MTLDIVIPCYTLTDELENFAVKCAQSYKGFCDKIIISEDGGRFSHRLLALCDLYLFGQDNVGFTANVNRGWKNSNADYTAIVNSDTYLIQGDLYQLCKEGRVTSPEIVNQCIDRLAGPFFCVPKTIREERGLLVEEMKTYCSDSEYDERVKDIFVKVPEVKIFHHQTKTVSTAHIEGGAELERDRSIYAAFSKRNEQQADAK
jgi:hypothetical protein